MEKYTADYLKSVGIHDLRNIMRTLGGTPSTKTAKELREEILKIQAGEQSPQRSTRGRKAKIREVNELTPYDTKITDVFKLCDSAPIEEECSAVEMYMEYVEGVFEPNQEGYGFLRTNNYECTSGQDIFVSKTMVKEYGLRRGDYVAGRKAKVREQGSDALKFVHKINDVLPYIFKDGFKDLDEYKVCYPSERLTLERANMGLSIRAIDLLSPIGKGQRGLIVAPPKAGKTTLLKQIAMSMKKNNVGVHIIMLLIDERPEEVTDMQSTIHGEVVSSTFDETPEHHVKIAELVLARAKHLVETGRDVVILLDSLTRLARAYNTFLPPSGKTLSGGLDPAAMQMPKKFFGSARNIAGYGSLTVLATVLVDTGSKMDEVIYEELKGTGNMEIYLTRELSDRRIFPAIDFYRSGTRNDDLLLSPEELECAQKLRRLFDKDKNASENILDMMSKTFCNKEFVGKMDTWIKLYENNRKDKS